MRFLVRFKESDLPKDRQLQTVRAVARVLGVDPRSPKWTSRGALELDVFGASKADVDLFISAAEPVAEVEFVRDLNVASPYIEETELLAEARELFNSERYWECHEVLEGLWRQKQGEEKRLIQAIILVCASFVHHQKGEDEVALGVLARADGQLDYRLGLYHGFEISTLKRNVKEILRSGRFTEFPI